MKENVRQEAENAKLKIRIIKLEQIIEKNTKLKDRIMKLEYKQIQIITNKQKVSLTKNISLLIKSHFDKKKNITFNLLFEIEYSLI